MSPGPAAFEALVRELGGDLYRYAYWLGRDRQHAEDVVQEALIRGWRSFSGLRDRAAAKSWLFSIVRNEHRRIMARRGEQMESIDFQEVDVPDERAVLIGQAMREALAALPAGYAEPLALQVLGGFTCAEIATMLQTTEGATMTRLTRARQALRRLIEPAAAGARQGGRT